MRRSRRFIKASGFTLIELVIAMVIGSMMAGFIAMMITTPLQAYTAQSRRSGLSDSAQAAIRTMGADIRKALPNSLRTDVVGSAVALEMINVAEVANYRTDSGETLTTDTSEESFDVVASMSNDLPPNARLVVGNTRNAATSAYRSNGASGVITPFGSSIQFQDPDRTRISVTPGFTFTEDSPRNRVFVVTTATRFECDPGNGELRRYRNLPITESIGPVAAAFDVIARDVSACTFRVDFDGTTDHGGIAILEITFSRFVDGNNESMRIARQIRVENPS